MRETECSNQTKKSKFVEEESIMNLGFGMCGVLVIPFAIMGVLFAIFKGKAAKFVLGFSSLPKEEQALYMIKHIFLVISGINIFCMGRHNVNRSCNVICFNTIYGYPSFHHLVDFVF